MMRTSPLRPFYYFVRLFMSVRGGYNNCACTDSALQASLLISSVKSYPSQTFRSQTSWQHGCPPVPIAYPLSHLVAVSAPSAKDRGATLAERVNILQQAHEVVGWSSNTGPWTYYKPHDQRCEQNQAKNPDVRIVHQGNGSDGAAGQPRCECNTADDRGVKPASVRWVCLRMRMCVCMRYAVCCIRLHHHPSHGNTHA